MSIGKSWEEWSRMALPEGAPVNQRVAMKTAFMCGAAIALQTITESQDQPTKIVLMNEELQEFIAMFGTENLGPMQ